MAEPNDVTRLIQRSRDGDAAAAEELMPLIYDQLHALARRQMDGERRGHTLQPTALVHEAYVRLADGPHSSWENRAHFYAAAATAVRRILVEHARSRRARRARDLPSAAVDVAGLPAREDDDRILSVDRALERLSAEQPTQARLVEMRYFGGLKVDEVAAALRLSPRTVARDWVVAKAWLARELREEHGFDD